MTKRAISRKMDNPEIILRSEEEAREFSCAAADSRRAPVRTANHLMMDREEMREEMRDR